MARMDVIAPEALLEPFSPERRATAERLRDVVRAVVPEAIERVRTGWHLIGYDVPHGRRTRYFAFVAPEVEHVHLGFEHGWCMADPDGLLGGDFLRQVRFLTFRAADEVDETAIAPLVIEAARVARLARSERLALVLDREAIG
jgi:hypothetical protein